VHPTDVEAAAGDHVHTPITSGVAGRCEGPKFDNSGQHVADRLRPIKMKMLEDQKTISYQYVTDVVLAVYMDVHTPIPSGVPSSSSDRPTRSVVYKEWRVETGSERTVFL
jgi:hypothetical protein